MHYPNVHILHCIVGRQLVKRMFANLSLRNVETCQFLMGMYREIKFSMKFDIDS